MTCQTSLLTATRPLICQISNPAVKTPPDKVIRYSFPPLSFLILILYTLKKYSKLMPLQRTCLHCSPPPQIPQTSSSAHTCTTLNTYLILGPVHCRCAARAIMSLTLGSAYQLVLHAALYFDGSLVIPIFTWRGELETNTTSQMMHSRVGCNRNNNQTLQSIFHNKKPNKTIIEIHRLTTNLDLCHSGDYHGDAPKAQSRQGLQPSPSCPGQPITPCRQLSQALRPCPPMKSRKQHVRHPLTVSRRPLRLTTKRLLKLEIQISQPPHANARLAQRQPCQSHHTTRMPLSLVNHQTLGAYHATMYHWKKTKNSIKTFHGHMLHTSPNSSRRAAERHLRSQHDVWTVKAGGHCRLTKQSGLNPKT